FKATVKVSAVPHTTYTGKEVTLPNIKQAWKIGKDHPLVMAAASALEGIGEPVGYTYWSFGTDLGVICGKYGMGAVGYSPMQEYYCHRPVDKCRIDFMERALVGNIAIYDKWAELPKEAFKLEQ
ncbi:MAG: peptidase dimerization protein, partial [Eubacterium sp.]|nr:peptidase dimerization protein [Eubacterium sp.]